MSLSNLICAISIVVENEALVTQLLQWVEERPRTYGDAMEAWKTTCPRLTVWEDALIAGLIEIDSSHSKNDAHVRLTLDGREMLARK